MQPTIGRIVHAICDPTYNNGSDRAPAIITRVWGDQHSDGCWTVNVKLILDGDQNHWKTSILLFDTEDQAAANTPTGGIAAFWPPRV